jgi:hypothetical protein
MFALLAAPAALQRSFGGDTAPYVVTTIALALLTSVAALTWRNRHQGNAPDARPRIPARSHWFAPATILVAAVAAALLFVTCRNWLDQILTIPLDPFRGEMLVVVREGVRRALEGRNPYTTYYVPWSVPLPYGPMLWAPYAIPMLLRVDPRFLTVVGELFVPVACATAAIASAARGRFAAAAGALVMLGAIGLNGSLEQFTSTGHTPVYWPLLVLFVWLTARARWHAGALLLGLLVVARLTMIAVVPVWLMAVWQLDRPRFAGASVRLGIAIALPFLPFAIWDPHALVNALYGSYQSVIKTTVWTDATVPHTIGVTGVLLTHHLHGFVEAAQAGVMAIVYAASWVLLRRGRAPVALMGIALLAFSMTTLWPIFYFYFDVFLFFAAGILADIPWQDTRRSASSLARGWTAVLAATVVLVAGFGAAMLRPRTDERPSATWRDGPRLATIPLVRRTISPALVDVRIDGVSVSPQRMTVALNGLSLGTVDLFAGVDHVMLAIPESRWQIGANTLELSPEMPITFREVIVRPTRSLGIARP